MDSIVLELQRKASKSDSDMTELLRGALIVARKLNLNEFENWLYLELNGYKNSSEKDIPEYRKINGSLQWFNMVRGWCPVFIENQEIEKLVCNPKIYEPISEIEYLITGNNEHNLVYQLSSQQKMLLSNLGDGEVQEFRLLFPKSQFQSIVDRVRNILLDWTLELESKGILGEGLVFTTVEKQEAHKHNTIINHFHHQAQGLQFQQDTENSTQTQLNDIDINQIRDLVNSIEKNLPAIDGLDDVSKKTMEYEIKQLNEQLQKNTNLNIVMQSLKTIRNILEGATGSIVAQGLLYQISQLGFF